MGCDHDRRTDSTSTDGGCLMTTARSIVLFLGAALFEIGGA